jgi:hypothetical protein
VLRSVALIEIGARCQRKIQERSFRIARSAGRDAFVRELGFTDYNGGSESTALSSALETDSSLLRLVVHD